MYIKLLQQLSYEDAIDMIVVAVTNEINDDHACTRNSLCIPNSKDMRITHGTYTERTTNVCTGSKTNLHARVSLTLVEEPYTFSSY